MHTSRASPAADPGTLRRWGMLAASLLAQTSTAVMIHGPAFLIPALHGQLGLSLVQAGVVAAASTVGVMTSLILWGYAADTYGERVVLLCGLAGTTLAGLVATQVHGTLALAAALFFAGLFGSSTNSASGRVVLGWFPPERRGLAMGIRQMAQPLGVALAAITIPVIAGHGGVGRALLVPTVACLIGAIAVGIVVIDPPRTERSAEPDQEAGNPYRASWFLQRIHAVSMLLVVPQFLVWTFALVWLTDDRGWSPGAAGALIAASQIVGACGRIAVGWLSDLVHSRMRPLRWVSIAAAVTMASLGGTAGLGPSWSSVAVALLVVATSVTVADNGLAFTSVAERAGPNWSGRSLGVQNTAQFLTASVVPPVAGAAITALGFPAVFAAAAFFPVLAIGLVPVRDERFAAATDSP